MNEGWHISKQMQPSFFLIGSNSDFIHDGLCVSFREIAENPPNRPISQC